MKNKFAGLVLIVFTGILSVGGTWISKTILHHSNRIYEGVCIVLDAGHGGKDKGAMYEDIYESEINLNLVLYLKKELENTGMKVILTRKDEKDLANDNATIRKSDDLKERMKIINNEQVDFYISVHMNSFADTNVKGSQIFYKEGNEDALMFAKCIQNNIQDFTKSKLEIKTGDYYILNNTDKVGVLLECGFLSNAQDRYNFSKESYQKRFAFEVKEGIVNFLKAIYE